MQKIISGNFIENKKPKNKAKPQSSLLPRLQATKIEQTLLGIKRIILTAQKREILDVIGLQKPEVPARTNLRTSFL